MAWRPKYTESEIRDAVENSPSLAASLRRLGLRAAGGNHRTLKRHIAHYGVSTEHFNPNWALRAWRAPCGDAACGGAGRGLELPPRCAEASPLRPGAQGEAVRAVRTGRALARAPDGADSRSHQWRRQRQPAREPADRLSQLRRHPRHPLRSAQSHRVLGPRVSALRKRIPAQVPAAALLQPDLRNRTARAATRPGPRHGRWSGRRTTCSFARRPHLASAPWGASTGCRITRCANGCGGTRPTPTRRQRPRMRSTVSRRRHERGRWAGRRWR